MTTLESIQTKRLDALVPWDTLDHEAALANPQLLDLVREACLIESYFAIYTSKMMQLLWHDVAATSILSVEAFEAYIHFVTLRRYLDEVDYRPIADDEIVNLRKGGMDAVSSDELRELVNFMATEHFAAEFFRDLGREADEPVLQAIMARFAPEEDTHSQFAADLIAERIRRSEDLRDAVLDFARHFRHVGAYALPSVSNVTGDNVEAILRFDRRIERLVGRRLGQAAPVA